MGYFQSFILLLSRLAIAPVFFSAAIQKMFSWQETQNSMQAHGMKMTGLFLFGAICVEIFGSISLVLGWRMKISTWLLVLFMIPVIYIFHDFWHLAEGSERALETLFFFKDLAIFGGLLSLTCSGAGRYSIDGE